MFKRGDIVEYKGSLYKVISSYDGDLMLSTITDENQLMYFDDYTHFSEHMEVLVEGIRKPIKKELRFKKKIRILEL